MAKRNAVKLAILIAAIASSVGAIAIRYLTVPGEKVTEAAGIAMCYPGND